MRKNIALNNFTGGEWSPFLDGRSDLQKYESACIRMENFRPLPWGGAGFRPGTEFFGFAKFGNKPCRLIPFNYSTSLSYVIEMGDLYMRFWNSNGTPVMTTGMSPVPVEVVSPFPFFLLNQIQFKEINAEVRFVHNSEPPQTLTYSGPGLWSLGPTNFKYPVLLDQNANQALPMSVASALQGASTTLTVAPPGWFTATYYPKGVSIQQNATGSLHTYTAQAGHTSGVFLTDLAAGLWKQADVFNTAHVGSYWELQQLRPSASALVDLNNQTVGVQVFSSAIEMEGDWTFTTSQFWWGEVQVQRSVDGGTTWVVVRDFTAKSDQNYSTSGTETAPNIGYPAVLYRIAYTMAGAPFDPAVWVGSTPTQYAFAQASLESEDAYVAGLFLVTAFIDVLNVTVSVVLPPNDTSASFLWSEGAFSAYRGFPGTIAFYEQRVLYSGTTFQANTIWGSVTADFDNFQYSSDDDGALAFQPAVCQQNQTAWVATLLNIHLCTSGEEILMGSGNLDEALTPSNVTMRAQSYYGSAMIQPLLMQNSLLFVERNGQRLREMRELSPYIVPTDFAAPDLTLMAQHITQPGIFQMDFGRLPDPLAYFIRSDGVMPVMTYNREQNIMAWARYVTQGRFESVASIYGAPADEVWVSVARVLNGVSRRCIEGFTTDPTENPSPEANLLLDCGFQTPFTGQRYSTVGGLTWLANLAVTAVVDGAEYINLPVDGTGLLTLPAGVSGFIVNVGLPYTGYLSPMKPTMQDQEGSSEGRKVRVSEIVLRVRSSVSVEYAGGRNPAEADWKLQSFRSPGDPVGSMTPPSTTNQDGTANPNGIADWPLDGPWPDGASFSGQINLRQSHPFSLTIIGAFTKFDTL